MDRQKLRTLLAGLDLEGSPAEVESRQRMLELLEKPDCFLRSCFPGHFTGSALVLSADGTKTLMHHHRFLDRWLQFGGHCDGEENVAAVAVREAEEESGISGFALASERPFDLDIHAIPGNPKRGEPPHEHYDLRYVLIAPENAQPQTSDESHELRWFTPAEALDLTIDPGLERLIRKWISLLKRRGAHVG